MKTLWQRIKCMFGQHVIGIRGAQQTSKTMTVEVGCQACGKRMGAGTIPKRKIT